MLFVDRPLPNWGVGGKRVPGTWRMLYADTWNNAHKACGQIIDRADGSPKPFHVLMDVKGCREQLESSAAALRDAVTIANDLAGKAGWLS